MKVSLKLTWQRFSDSVYLLTLTSIDYLKSKVVFFFQTSEYEIGLIMGKIIQTEGTLFYNKSNSFL